MPLEPFPVLFPAQKGGKGLRRGKPEQQRVWVTSDNLGFTLYRSDFAHRNWQAAHADEFMEKDASTVSEPLRATLLIWPDYIEIWHSGHCQGPQRSARMDSSVYQQDQLP